MHSTHTWAVRAGRRARLGYPLRRRHAASATPSSGSAHHPAARAPAGRAAHIPGSATPPAPPSHRASTRRSPWGTHRSRHGGRTGVADAQEAHRPEARRNGMEARPPQHRAPGAAQRRRTHRERPRRLRPLARWQGRRRRRGEEAHRRPPERAHPVRALRPRARPRRRPRDLRRAPLPPSSTPPTASCSGSTTCAIPSTARAPSRAFTPSPRCARCSGATSTPPARSSPRSPFDHPHLRPYQRDANAAVEQAIADRKRNLLVAMATGTGKTFTLVHQIYRLMKAGVARRVLFLVDRRALAAQAVRAFSAFEVEPGKKFDQVYEVYASRFQTEDFGEDERFDPKILPQKYLTDPQPGHAFVFVATIQRMAMNVLGRGAVFGIADESPDDDADRLDIPPPRLRRDRRRRVPPRVHRARALRLALHPQPLRRHQGRPHGHAREPHHGVLSPQGLRVRLRAGRARRVPRGLRRRAHRLRGACEGRLPPRGRERRAHRPRHRPLAHGHPRRRARLRRHGHRARRHRARLEPEDPRRGEVLRRRARAAVRALPQDPHLRGQRPAPPLPRRPARRARARRLRPRP
jgi:hypothetical protein